MMWGGLVVVSQRVGMIEGEQVFAFDFPGRERGRRETRRDLLQRRRGQARLREHERERIDV